VRVVFVEASSLESSLAGQLSVPLDRVRVARRSLSFAWCSLLAAVSLLAVLHVGVAALRRCVDAGGRLRRLFDEPSSTADATSPSDSGGASADRAGVSDRDAVGVAATASQRRATVDEERRHQHQHHHHHHHHHHHNPSSRHLHLQSSSSAVGRLSSVGGYGDRRQQRPGSATSTLTRAGHSAAQHGPPRIGRELAVNVERIYYTDGIVESNV